MELKSNNFIDVDVSHGGEIDFFLVCCIGVIGPKLANMLQKNRWDSLFISKSSSWVVKLQTTFELKLGSLDYKIDGCFKHKNCKRLSTFGEPFTNFSCVVYFEIPQEPKFRKNVVWGDATNDKGGCRGQDRRLKYLSIIEPITHSCGICKKYKVPRLFVGFKRL